MSSVGGRPSQGLSAASNPVSSAIFPSAMCRTAMLNSRYMNVASSAPSGLASVMVIDPSTGARATRTDDMAEDF
jgi:hypothetical protein